MLFCFLFFHCKVAQANLGTQNIVIICKKKIKKEQRIVTFYFCHNRFMSYTPRKSPTFLANYDYYYSSCGFITKQLPKLQKKLDL